MKINNILTYKPQKGERFLIDTNIWLYLFCPLGDYKPYQIKPYEIFFNDSIKNGSLFYISSIIVSEFINRYFRLEFNILSATKSSVYSDFKKDSRGSKEFLSTASAIKITLIKNILRISKPIDDKFSSINISNIIDQIENIDFNDEYILQLSSISDLKIVTNDFDFGLSKSAGGVLTANRKLLKLSA